MDKNKHFFFTLLKAGLWEKDIQLSQFEQIDYSIVLSLAKEQSVVGLVTAGIEHVTNVNVPKEAMLLFVGHSLQLEQRNLSMNKFVAELINLLQDKEIYAVLVKGQGIAQCYERPLWRASGDVDLLLSEDNYLRAKGLLLPMAVDVEDEYKGLKHIGMTMLGGFVVELHGTLHSRLSSRADSVIDDVQKDVFYGGSVKSWMNNNTMVFLPKPDNDVLFVFTHILHHYYLEGIGLRQICDWCRLLWKNQNEINTKLLEHRLKKAGIMSEWYAFAALAVDWLGMPVGAMPLYSSEAKWRKKAIRIIAFVLETGSFGHNRRIKGGKINSAWRKTKDFARHVLVFPCDSVRFYFHFIVDGIRMAILS